MTRGSTADATARLQAAEAERELTRQLKQALKTPEGSRSAEQAALLRAHPEAAARHQSAMNRTAARKLQEEVNAAEVEDDPEVLQQKVVQGNEEKKGDVGRCRPTVVSSRSSPRHVVSLRGSDRTLLFRKFLAPTGGELLRRARQNPTPISPRFRVLRCWPPARPP